MDMGATPQQLEVFKSQQGQQAKPTWVRLHLVKQGADMPSTITGLLYMELPDKFTLACTATFEDDDTTRPIISEGMVFVFKQFVWQCTVLGDKPAPPTTELDEDRYGGGLG